MAKGVMNEVGDTGETEFLEETQFLSNYSPRRILGFKTA